jgi:cohesin loading factor subunit SCC2
MLRACDGTSISEGDLLTSARLRGLKDQYAVTAPTVTTSTALMLYITALIVEHVNLDKLAVDNDDVQREIRSITEVCFTLLLLAKLQMQLYEYFFDLYLHFSQYNIYQNAPSFALGSLFQAYPSLILRDEAVEWMEQVFASPDMDAQARLFKVIYDFLDSEAERKASGKASTTGLVGASQDITESG